MPGMGAGRATRTMNRRWRQRSSRVLTYSAPITYHNRLGKQLRNRLEVSGHLPRSGTRGMRRHKGVYDA
ncbi:hypothetical protein FsymDg_3755 [Candidatus Protofrankia datiscae]|uniref:Uncharacterized protein n=1 Tax=Candidatus Protofrankia datiscae TaxID=2716812 RepID=F8B510_9ACTN|nr:hypothetical protein FsymDg_3755 [Candidatus Protofrankia datiscae]